MGKLTVKMDNDSGVTGKVALEEAEAALNALAGDPAVDRRAAKPIFDLATGKLIQIDFENFPTDNQAALDALANSGGIGKVIPSPDPKFIFDLADIAFTGGLEAGKQVIQFAAVDLLGDESCFVNLGLLDSASYNDGDDNAAGCPIVALFLQNYVGAATPLEVELGELKFTHDGGSELTVANAGQLSVPAPTMGQNNTVIYYMASDRKVYEFGTQIDGILKTRSFAEAFALGAK